jgi:hypothetical protein
MSVDRLNRRLRITTKHVRLPESLIIVGPLINIGPWDRSCIWNTPTSPSHSRQSSGDFRQIDVRKITLDDMLWPACAISLCVSCRNVRLRDARSGPVAHTDVA